MVPVFPAVIAGVAAEVQIGVLTAAVTAAGLWLTRRSSADTLAQQRDAETWRRMQDLLAERDATIAALKADVARHLRHIRRLEQTIRDLRDRRPRA